jgi:hypothetical protein
MDLIGDTIAPAFDLAKSRVGNWQLGAAASLILLADLRTAAIRTALRGNADLCDPLIILTGIHRQLDAQKLHEAEYPACAALTTGYVFRVENPATVFFLQRISKTGCLTNLTISSQSSPASGFLGGGSISSFANKWTTAVYGTLPLLTLSALIYSHSRLHDSYLTMTLILIIAARIVDTVLIRRRAISGWHGAPEPGVQGDILVLLSQDRWTRIRGPVDDLKAVLSGRWLREPTAWEATLHAVATLLVYAAVGLGVLIGEPGKRVLLGLALVSVAAVGLVNLWTRELRMHGRTLGVDRERGLRRYARRLEMVEDMLTEEGRHDESMRGAFARMGMTVPGSASRQKRDARGTGAVIM